MLYLTIPDGEVFNEITNEFIVVKEQTLQLEHSLVSLSKWESKWKKPFLSKEDKTDEETTDYIKCMTITQNVSPFVYLLVDSEMIEEINNYIQDSMTATTFSKNQKSKTNLDIITSEIIYYWMVAFNIPFECQKWHLNRLLTLINVCNIKNQPAKKISRQELLARNRSLNDARRKKLNTKG